MDEEKSGQLDKKEFTDFVSMLIAPENSTLSVIDSDKKHLLKTHTERSIILTSQF
jgi:hypothetical protein